MKGEIVVLTGAAGCLGFHTLRLLLTRDHQVSEIRCLDLREPENSMKKLIDEEHEKLKRKETEHRKKIRWIKGDVRDINVVEQTLDGADCVIHCAALIDVWTDVGEQNVSELESTNVAGTENLLNASIRLGISKFIHVSSFEVYTGINTIYYATETTLPETKWFLFGPSATTKRDAEERVKKFANHKLARPARDGKDSLNAIIVRFSTMYGEFDRHYVSKILEATKFLGGSLRRLDFIWIRQQPIYAANAAWSLIKAKDRMEKDQSISGEEFHITDDTAIGDPFDFVEPYVECKGMRVTKSSYPFIPIYILLLLFFAIKRFARAVDFLGILSDKKSRLQQAIEKDNIKILDEENSEDNAKRSGNKKRRWFHYIMPQTLGYMCNSNFLNRTKASLRLDYEPIFDPEESERKSIDWYKNHLQL